MNYQSKYKILRYSTNYLAVCKERYIKTIYKKHLLACFTASGSDVTNRTIRLSLFAVDFLLKAV